jgi:hypothetical protein
MILKKMNHGLLVTFQPLIHPMKKALQTIDIISKGLIVPINLEFQTVCLLSRET